MSGMAVVVGCMPPRARLAPLVALVILALLPAVASPDPLGPLDSQTRLTQIGPDGNPAFDINDPAVAYDSRREVKTAQPIR
jgi:hypothetical protein